MKNIEILRQKIFEFISNLDEKEMCALAEAFADSNDYQNFSILSHCGITYDNTVCSSCKHCPIKEVDGDCVKDFTEWALEEASNDDL